MQRDETEYSSSEGPAVRTSMSDVDHAHIWDEEAARRYDSPGVGMFAPEYLGPDGRTAPLARQR